MNIKLKTVLASALTAGALTTETLAEEKSPTAVAKNGMWNAFVCEQYYDGIGHQELGVHINEFRAEKERLFQIGVTQGRKFIELWEQNGRAGHAGFPIEIDIALEDNWNMPAEFKLGYIASSASNAALKEIFDGPDTTARSKALYRAKQCRKVQG